MIVFGQMDPKFVKLFRVLFCYKLNFVKWVSFDLVLYAEITSTRLSLCFLVKRVSCIMIGFQEMGLL
jgi:hypothetical protein